MKKALRRITVSSVTIAALAHAQTSPPPSSEPVQPVQLEPMRKENKNRLSISYRMGLNITADFKHLGGFTPLSNPGAATGGSVNRTYDNGYNLVDITGNNHGPGFENTTWNWGYQNASSLQNGQLNLTSSSSSANAASNGNSNDPQPGFEIGYQRELLQKGRWRFGLEAALGYARLSITDSRTLRATVNQITDSYSVPGGVTIPPAPYNGSYNGPGAVIPSDPTSRTLSTISQGATIVGQRSLDSDVFSLKLGPYAEVPLKDKFSLLFDGGLYLAVGNSHFSFQEAVTIPGVGTQIHSGSGSQTDWLVGGYIGGDIEYALNDDVSLFVGAQFQTAGRPATHENGKVAILNLDKSVIVSIGASYSF